MVNQKGATALARCQQNRSCQYSQQPRKLAQFPGSKKVFFFFGIGITTVDGLAGLNQGSSLGAQGKVGKQLSMPESEASNVVLSAGFLDLRQKEQNAGNLQKLASPEEILGVLQPIEAFFQEKQGNSGEADDGQTSADPNSQQNDVVMNLIRHGVSTANVSFSGKFGFDSLLAEYVEGMKVISSGQVLKGVLPELLGHVADAMKMSDDPEEREKYFFAKVKFFVSTLSRTMLTLALIVFVLVSQIQDVVEFMDSTQTGSGRLSKLIQSIELLLPEGTNLRDILQVLTGYLMNSKWGIHMHLEEVAKGPGNQSASFPDGKNPFTGKPLLTQDITSQKSVYSRPLNPLRWGGRLLKTRSGKNLSNLPFFQTILTETRWLSSLTAEQREVDYYRNHWRLRVFMKSNRKGIEKFWSQDMKTAIKGDAKFFFLSTHSALLKKWADYFQIPKGVRNPLKKSEKKGADNRHLDHEDKLNNFGVIKASGSSENLINDSNPTQVNVNEMEVLSIGVQSEEIAPLSVGAQSEEAANDTAVEPNVEAEEENSLNESGKETEQEEDDAAPVDALSSISSLSTAASLRLQVRRQATRTPDKQSGFDYDTMPLLQVPA